MFAEARECMQEKKTQSVCQYERVCACAWREQELSLSQPPKNGLIALCRTSFL